MSAVGAALTLEIAFHLMESDLGGSKLQASWR